jgi:hypothetical protein
MLKKYSLNRLLVLFTTVGFAFLLLDTTIEHWDLLKEEIMVYIPLVFSLIGLVISSIAFFVWKDKIIRYLQIFLFISFLVAGTGVYFHVTEEEDEINLTIEEREHEEKEKDKPLMAPIAFAGLAVVSLLGTMRKWDAEVLKS